MCFLINETINCCNQIQIKQTSIKPNEFTNFSMMILISKRKYYMFSYFVFHNELDIKISIFMPKISYANIFCSKILIIEAAFHVNQKLIE